MTIAQDTNFHTYENNTIHSYRFDQDKGWGTYGQDEFIQLMHSWAKDFARVLRRGGSFAIFCADAYVSHLMDALEAAGLKTRRVITWRKPNAVPINRKTMMMSSCEYVVMGVKGSKATFNADLPLDNSNLDLAHIERYLVADKAAVIVESEVRKAVDTITTTGEARPAAIEAAITAAVSRAANEAAKRVRAMYVTDENGNPYLRACVPNFISNTSKGGNRLHPTEKPTAILAYLTALLSRPGDIVLDPFAGSGSTGEAAMSLGRIPVLVEMDETYYKAATKRLEQYAADANTEPTNTPT